MKHFRKTIALFLVVVMLTTTMGSTVLAGTENQGFSDQAETTVDSRFLDGIDTDGYDYVITSQEQADELRVSDDSKSILVACGSVYLSGIKSTPTSSFASRIAPNKLSSPFTTEPPTHSHIKGY